MFDQWDEKDLAGNGLGATDQAAGLRRWAERQGLLNPDGTPKAAVSGTTAEAVVAPAPVAAEHFHEEPVYQQPAAPTVRHTLMILGLPDSSAEQTHRAWQALERWHLNGHRWVGNPYEWRVIAIEADSPHLSILAGQQSRWALWVDTDLDSFRRAYLVLRELAASGGPNRLLVLHPGIPTHRGLLSNLQQAAAGFLGIELLLFPEYPGQVDC